MNMAADEVIAQPILLRDDVPSSPVESMNWEARQADDTLAVVAVAPAKSSERAAVTAGMPRL